MTGMLEASGLGEAVTPGESKDNEILRSLRQESNRRLLKELSEAEQGQRLLEIAREDARLGRLSQPRPIEGCRWWLG